MFSRKVVDILKVTFGRYVDIAIGIRGPGILWSGD